MPSTRTLLEALLAEGPLVLSGGLGTELQRRGAPTPLPLWSTAPLLEAPEIVRTLHRDYVRAGARLVTANTFRTDRVTLGRAGQGARVRELNKLAVRLAREGVAQARPAYPVLVAGSLAPVEDCYRPDLVPADEQLVIEHGIKVGHLVAAGAALAMVETMNTAREARIALEACRAGNLPAMVAFTCGAGARLRSGESIAEAVAAVTPLRPLALLVNCCAPEVATEALIALRTSSDLPVGVYANGRGRPDDDQGWRFRAGTSRRRYVQHARVWLDEGATLIGGCCGTDPRTIRALARMVARRRSTT